jgi:hypothetical protein
MDHSKIPAKVACQSLTGPPPCADFSRNYEAKHQPPRSRLPKKPKGKRRSKPMRRETVDPAVLPT